MRDLYKQSGVDVEAGYQVVKGIQKHIKRTERKGTMGGFGGFAGAFDLSSLNYKEPVLLSGTDGVGTKLKLAFEMDKHDTIGIDAVAMCVNDIVAQGAEPLYFLDYIACGKNDPDKIEQIVKGIADGCEQAGCALIGGETAEMPGMYEPEEYDLAGFVVGAAEKSEVITGEKIQAGDALIGITSSGVHSNGFSLVRKIIQDQNLNLQETYAPFTKTLGEVLLSPTKIYVKAVLAVKNKVTGLSHITGGGFFENLPRMLPEGLGVKVDLDSWERPEIFPFLQKAQNIEEEEMFGVFNMGIGMVMAVKQADVSEVLKQLEKTGEKAWEIGEVTSIPGVVLTHE